MATTDTRTGFRLPWSSDRSHDDAASADAVQADLDEAAPETTPEATPEANPETAGQLDEKEVAAWPQTDVAARLGMAQPVATPVPAPQVARKPTQLMADLSAAILATTGTARDRALAAVDEEAARVSEAIRVASLDGAAAIRRQSEDALAAIKEWSKAEIARIREEAETQVATRKATLESELASHAAAVGYRVGRVDEAVRLYRTDMDAFFGLLSNESDPARLATMAEAMPEPPALDALVTVVVDVDTLAPTGITEAVEAEVAEAEAVAEVAEVAVVEVAEVEAGPATSWSTSDDAWGARGADTSADADASTDDIAASDAADVPRWVTGETPNGSPGSDQGGDPLDRGVIMAAIEAAAEAAAEAVVAAEAAAESADQAEAAADVAETAAGLLVGRVDAEEETEGAEAALAARVDAGGFDTQSFADRFARLMPSHGEGAPDGEPRSTRVVVTGLVSVASIASFKRHLARLAGVASVGVASGPEGEFVFKVDHRPDVLFRDVIPSMPGFAARVTGTGDGVVHVTARDPESEG